MRPHLLNITEEENKLFNVWKQELGYSDDKFAPDGLLYKGLYQYRGKMMTDSNDAEIENWRCAENRILILTKDQNAGNSDAWDVREESYSLDVDLTGFGGHPSRMCKYLATWVYAIDHLMDDRIENTLSSIPTNVILSHWYKRAAVVRMNLKKLKGGSSITNSKFWKFINNSKEKEFIIKQLNLYKDANIILCCAAKFEGDTEVNPILNFLKENCFPDLSQISESNYTVYYSPSKGVKVLNLYHFASSEINTYEDYYEESRRMIIDLRNAINQIAKK